ncbi:MAG TPA: heparan-alpha-glucosaminide N-acetyltransferase domain-containing protein [Candidatus Acidoferrales bacterium]|nr:heparan-alpha-glucosaminide N-acetyltransferase domain-containing protein [Candidatus Acidoferrales bacterium]
MAETSKQRVDYLDWLRGFACLGMFEVHCYDAWLRGSARHGAFFGLSQFSGTVPAPLFIFLSGVSCALVSDQMQRKGASSSEIATRIIRRGAEIFGLGLLFRVQEYVLGLPGAPTTDLLRVDVLNLIGLSLLFIGVFLQLSKSVPVRAILAAAIALGIACATPPLWTTWRPHWLPWFVESYINGVHIYNEPQPWLFPVFPWTGFAFAGLAAGALLMKEGSVKNQFRMTSLLAAVGAGLFFLSLWLDRRSQFYAVYDYWHTSPNFFLARTGICLVVTWMGYVWCRWGLGQVGFSPLIQLGRASLLVYWVHIEFVYGRFSILPRASEGVGMATLGLLIVTAAMVLLAVARLSWKKRGPEIIARLRRPASSPG